MIYNTASYKEPPTNWLGALLYYSFLPLLHLHIKQVGGVRFGDGVGAHS